MSLSISFINNKFYLNEMKLPSRYFYFDKENYIKLVCIGEGIFPKDKIKTNLHLKNSNAIITSESATKVYPSKKEYGVNKISINLENSNCEFLNDELILFKNARLLQFIKVKIDSSSTFFFADILSHGRSYEDFSFDNFIAKNSFYVDNSLEYFEKYNVKGQYIKNYTKDYDSINKLFAKIYLKTDFEKIEELLAKSNIQSYSYSHSKKIMLMALSSDDMHNLKKDVKEIWNIYRKTLQKDEFDLGKF